MSHTKKAKSQTVKDPGKTWSIRDVSYSAIQTAQKLAKQEGKPLGPFLSEFILREAVPYLTKTTDIAKPSDIVTVDEEWKKSVDDRLKEIEERQKPFYKKWRWQNGKLIRQ